MVGWACLVCCVGGFVLLVVWVGGFGWVGGRVIGWVVDGWERLLPLRLPGQLEDGEEVCWFWVG